MNPKHIISFVSIKPSNNIQICTGIENALVESSFSRLITHSYNLCPSIVFKGVLIYIIEPLLILIYSTKYVHLFISIDRCMPISPFDGSFGIINDFPLVFNYVVYQYVIKSFISVPSSKDNHFMTLDYC